MYRLLQKGFDCYKSRVWKLAFRSIRSGKIAYRKSLHLPDCSCNNADVLCFVKGVSLLSCGERIQHSNFHDAANNVDDKTSKKRFAFALAISQCEWILKV